MSRRKHQRRVEDHYGTQLAPWMADTLGICIPLILAIYVATMPL